MTRWPAAYGGSECERRVRVSGGCESEWQAWTCGGKGQSCCGCGSELGRGRDLLAPPWGQKPPRPLSSCFASADFASSSPERAVHAATLNKGPLDRFREVDAGVGSWAFS